MSFATHGVTPSVGFCHFLPFLWCHMVLNLPSESGCGTIELAVSPLAWISSSSTQRFTDGWLRPDFSRNCDRPCLKLSHDRRMVDSKVTQQTGGTPSPAGYKARKLLLIPSAYPADCSWWLFRLPIFDSHEAKVLPNVRFGV